MDTNKIPTKFDQFIVDGQVTTSYLEFMMTVCKTAFGKQMTDHGNGVFGEFYCVFREIKMRREQKYEFDKNFHILDSNIEANLKIYNGNENQDPASQHIRTALLELQDMRKNNIGERLYIKQSKYQNYDVTLDVRVSGDTPHYYVRMNVGVSMKDSIDIEVNTFENGVKLVNLLEKVIKK